jgi:hypothetical protein
MKTGPALVAIDPAWLRYGFYALLGKDILFTRDDPNAPVLAVHVTETTDPFGLVVTQLSYDEPPPSLRICIPWSQIAGIAFVSELEKAKECVGFCELPRPVSAPPPPSPPARPK